jgi:hypothetical protein
VKNNNEKSFARAFHRKEGFHQSNVFVRSLRQFALVDFTDSLALVDVYLSVGEYAGNTPCKSLMDQ